MIAKQVSKAHKSRFSRAIRCDHEQSSLLYRLRYVMNRCFTSEETPGVLWHNARFRENLIEP